MNKITKTYPCDGSAFEFCTTEDLLNLDYVKTFCQYSNVFKFSHFALSEKNNDLLGIYNDGASSWPIGRLETKEGVNLPTFTKKRKK